MIPPGVALPLEGASCLGPLCQPGQRQTSAIEVSQASGSKAHLSGTAPSSRIGSRDFRLWHLERLVGTVVWRASGPNRG